MKAQGSLMDTGDKAGPAVLAPYSSGSGCRGVDRDLLPLLNLQIFVKTTTATMHEAGDVAQLAECLPRPHRALGSSPSTA